MRKAFKSFLLLLAAGLTLNLGLLSCANDDSSSSSSAQTVKVITVTNGTANSGENVEISKLSTYLSTRGGKLYAELACTTEVAIANVKAGSTYYAKVTSTTPTTNTKVKVITVTNGTANAGEDVEIANLSTYLSTRGGKLYAEQACTTEVAIANVKAGTTYYAKVTSTTPTTNTKVKVITVTNGTANTGEDVEIANLSTYLSTRGGKLYAEQACTTEVAIANVKAGTTYYAKVTSTTPTTGGTDVYVVTYYLTSNDVSSKTKVAEQKIAIAKLADYIKYRGNKLYAKDDRTGETAVASVVAGNTYYVFYDDNTPKVKVWRVKDGTGTTTPEFIKENNDDGYDMVWIAYLDKHLKEKKVSTLYAWTNEKQGAAVATSAVTENSVYCISYLPAAAGTYTFTKNGKNYTLTTTAEGTYSIKEGTTETENGNFGLSTKELYTFVQQQLTTSYGTTSLTSLTPTGASLEVTYTISGTTLTEKTRTANYVTVTTVYASIPGMSNVSNNILITGLKEYLQKANNAKLWADKNKSKEVSPDAVEGEKEYFIVN